MFRITKKIFLFAFILFASADYSQAQPCLAGWRYRVPVIVDNSANLSGLTDFQVKVTANTQTLIVNGKAKLDGGDIRFLDKTGAVLPFWIEKGTYNSAATNFWVKVSTIPASGKDTIYFFYGEPGAVSLSSGEQAFDLFDDFNGASINSEKWSTCNPSRVIVANSVVSLSSGELVTEKSMLHSKAEFDYPVILESKITAINHGQGFIGLRNEAGEGYAVVYDDDQQPLVKMLQLLPDANCILLDPVNPANNAARSAGVTAGEWSFKWLPGNIQKYSWPGAVSEESWSDVQTLHTGKISVALGNANKSGSVSMDWVRVRKYTENEPSVTLGSEVSSVVSASASSNSPVCQESSIVLSAEVVAGAVYSWEGPEGFTASTRIAEVPNAQIASSGDFILTVSIPEGCFSITDTVNVQVDPSTVKGNITGSRVVCVTSNQGTVSLSELTGNVTRWESSPTGLTPWTTIEETATELNFSDLVTTTYYRAVIKSGVCNALFTDSVRIKIDQRSEGGVIAGTPEGCIGNNSGLMQVTGINGEILNWQYKRETGTAWVDIIGTDYNYTYRNLNESTFYRVKIKNGVCPEDYSDSVKVIIHPLPVIDIAADPVCKGSKSLFQNNSSISSGAISSWLWEYSDGGSSVIKNPVYTFQSSGNYEAKLTAKSDKGCVNSDSITVIINSPPGVDFTFENVCDRFPANFTSAISSPDAINSYSWTFGEGSATSSLSNPSHLYQRDGSYSVKLVVETDKACKDSSTRIISIYPRAHLSFEADTVFLGEKTVFRNTSFISSGNLTYHWAFGDNNTSTLNNPEHQYESPGNFIVRLTSESATGSCHDTIFKQYYVKDQTNASFTVNNECVYDTVRFVNTSYIPAGAKSYFWDFGDGATSTDSDPVHRYAIPGIYSVKLQVETIEGSIDEVFKNVTVYAQPVARFVTTSVCDDDPASFSNISSIPAGTLSFIWDFGDETILQVESPEHIYDTHGDYTVTLVAISGNNCMDTISSNITIYPKPVPAFSVGAVCLGSPSIVMNTSSIPSGTLTEYLWDFGDGTNSIEKDPVKEFTTSGDYTIHLTVKSNRGCIDSLNRIATVVDNPVAAFSKEDECFGTAIQFVNESNTRNSQVANTWYFGDGIGRSEAPDPAYLYTTPGTYEVSLVVQLSTGEDCKDSIAVPVTVFSLPTIIASNDTITSRGVSVNLLAQGGVNYVWEPALSLDLQGVEDPVATPLETTTYTVRGTDANGCLGKDQVVVTVEDDFLLFPSNVLTPDGNGQNDYWYIGNITAFPDARITVVDRWGKLVYETTGYTNDWAGVGGTDILPEGDYYYMISNPGTDKAYTGAVTILRAR